MSTRRAAPFLAFAGVAFHIACQPSEPVLEAPVVRVALRAEQTLRERPGGSLIGGTTLGVICFSVRPPTTVVTTDAAELVDAFRNGLAASGPPVTTAAARLSLPETGAGLQGEPCDLALFDDVDGDGQWAPGESYITAWTGGQGSYRVVHLSEPAAARAGARPGWNLLEGGVPPTYYATPAGHVAFIDPIVEAIPGR